MDYRGPSYSTTSSASASQTQSPERPTLISADYYEEHSQSSLEIDPHPLSSPSQSLQSYHVSCPQVHRRNSSYNQYPQSGPGPSVHKMPSITRDQRRWSQALSTAGMRLRAILKKLHPMVRTAYLTLSNRVYLTSRCSLPSVSPGHRSFFPLRRCTSIPYLRLPYFILFRLLCRA